MECTKNCSNKNNSKKTTIEEPKYTIGPATGDYLPVDEQHYPQLGRGAALALGFDSSLGGLGVSVINNVNSVTGEPLIDQNSIDYNKENTYEFEESYRMGRTLGNLGTVTSLVVGGTTGSNAGNTTEGASKTLNPNDIRFS